MRLDLLIRPSCTMQIRLTSEQLEALRRSANGLSLRFESWTIVNALIQGGYVEQGPASVVTITTKGREYLQKHAD
jgi:hypothetical protein